MANQVLEALGDGTRQAILDILLDGPRSVAQLSERLPVSRPAVSQHLRILARAGLVGYTTRGTRHLYHVHPEGLAELRAYVEQFWARALAAFEARAADEGSSEEDRKERSR
ncbi:MAG TPA: metalloregulator ArsR/SmtB family transcription factor [Actinomycetota bacterium]